MGRPLTGEYTPNFESYIGLVPEEDILAAMRANLARTVTFLNGIADRDATVCHPPYTWTIKQVVGHLTDTERIFGYRALVLLGATRPPYPASKKTITPSSPILIYAPWTRLLPSSRPSGNLISAYSRIYRLTPGNGAESRATTMSAFVPLRMPSSDMNDII